MIKGLIMRLEHLEPSNMALQREVRELTHMVTKIEENISFKKQPNDNKGQDALHNPLGDTLRAGIIDLKEEIRSQQRSPSNMKQNTH